MNDKTTFEDRSTLWVVHIGDDDPLALRARDEGFVCIGFSGIDATHLDTRETTKAAIEAVIPEASAKRVNSLYGQLYRFAHEMKVGDPIVLPVKPTKQIAIGKITGEYRFDNGHPSKQSIRNVEWLSIVPRTAFSQPVLNSFGAFLTVSTSNDHLEEVKAILDGKDTEAILVDDNKVADDEEFVALDEQATQATEDYLLKAWQRTGVHFEQVVAAVFRAMGYTAFVTHPSGDHGVDVIAHPDPLEIERPYVKVQVKSGTSTIGEPVVNQLKGLLNSEEKGILVSLGSFSTGALNVARGSANVTLIDASRFVELFLDRYERLDPSLRTRYPLKNVYVPVSSKKAG